MDVKVNVGTLTQAIADGEIDSVFTELLHLFRKRATKLIMKTCSVPE